jgi:tRNA pseudouridine38-40 synthase
VEYNGKNFAGWQVQNVDKGKVRTVQEEIEKALEKLLREKVNTFVSGRTDGHVSAKNQYFHFTTNSDIKPEKLPFALLSFLPKDISVKKAKYVSNDFDARYSVMQKEYHYMCYISNILEPLIDDYMLRLNPSVNIKKIKQAMKCFVGTNDFSAFYKKTVNTNFDNQIFFEKKKEFLKQSGLTKNERELNLLVLQRKHTAIRTITLFKLEKKKNILTFKIKGDGFLHNMARIIIGTAINVGEGKMSIETVKSLLKGGDRILSGKTIDAKALVLWEVYY